MKLAQRMDRILVESAFEVLVRARALEATGRNIVHLEIGEPDFPTPAHIIEAAKAALDQGWTHYGPTQGYPELREAVAAHVSATRSIRVGPQHVSIVPGGKPIIFFPMLALLEPGDEVIYPDPGFPIYQSMIQFLGATPVPIPLVESRGFSFDLDLLRDRLSSKTKMLVLNSPQNPTGGVIPRDAFCDGLDRIPGIHCARPGGAFYAFANITRTGMDSKTTADFLLNEAGVACLSGAAFGKYGEGYVRFSYANSYENLMEAVKRIESALVTASAR